MQTTILTAEAAYSMLGNENLWETATSCHRLRSTAGIPYSVCGGVAVCLHGYQRNTIDLDLIVEPKDAAEVKDVLSGAGLSCDADRKKFRSGSGVAVQFLMVGDRAGSGSEVRLPSPTGELNVEVIDGLPVVRLSKLIEIKIACGMGDVRRTHRDFADVVELIAIRQIGSSFARFLHKSVRKPFRQLVRNAQGDASM